jgi:large subunit ribosomal protein L15
MLIHELKAKKVNKGKIRVGRGGKRGTTSGRGQKGQKSRSGHVIRPAQRDLILRLPKKRGFRNKPKSDKVFALPLTMLLSRVKTFGNKEAIVVDRTFLVSLDLLPRQYRGVVKVIGVGDVALKLNVRGLKISSGAKEAIEKAGGKVE